MKKMNKAFAFLAGAALAFGGLFIGCSEDNGALNDPEKIIEDANETATKDAEAADKGETTEDSGDKGTTDKGGSGTAITFPLSIKPTTEGSSPAYPTDTDTSSVVEYKFTSPIAYSVGTKKHFDTGKYNTGTETKTENRWNLGGALYTGDGSKYNVYMKFDSAPSTKLTVKFFNTNIDRTITVVSGDTKTVGKVKTTKTDGTNGDLMSETFTVTKGSEVRLGATASGIWVAEVIWEEDATSDSTPSTPATGGTGTTTTGSGDTGNTGDTTTTGDTDKGSSDDQKATYTLDITKVPETTGATNKLDDTITVVSTKKNSSGTAQTIKYSLSGYVQMSGAGVGTDYALQLTLTGKATIKVKATKKSKGTAAAVKILDSAGKEAGKTTGIDENGATTLTEYSISNVAAGTYYLGADSNGCLLFSLVIEYK